MIEDIHSEGGDSGILNILEKLVIKLFLSSRQVSSTS